MVDEYLSDEERFEMAKKWWLENYKSIVAGALIAVLVVGGWRYWQYRVISRSQAAAAMFSELTAELAKQDKTGALATGKAILGQYADTPYAAQAALALAQINATEGKPADGEPMLQWVIKHAQDKGLKVLARLRLARLELASGDAQGALGTLSGAAPGGFAPLYDALRGDAYVSLGKPGDARGAYQRALEGWSENLGDRSLIQMKLDSLPIAAPAAATKAPKK